jgi:hypothetical protein
VRLRRGLIYRAHQYKFHSAARKLIREKSDVAIRVYSKNRRSSLFVAGDFLRAILATGGRLFWSALEWMEFVPYAIGLHAVTASLHPLAHTGRISWCVRCAYACVIAVAAYTLISRRRVREWSPVDGWRRTRNFFSWKIWLVSLYLEQRVEPLRCTEPQENEFKSTRIEL